MNRSRFALFFVFFLNIGTSLGAMDHGYTTIVPQHRSYTDHIPFDIAYIPSLFSVQHQMARYGIPKPQGTGYEFEQLSDEVYKEVTSILKELGFDYTSTYIVKLNPQWRTSTTTIVVTNSCIFVDQDEWEKLSDPLAQVGFLKIVHDGKLDVKDPIRSIKKYIIKRAIAHYNNGTYNKKLTSKLLTGVALAYIAYKIIPRATDGISDYASQANNDLGVTASIAAAAPTLIKACSAVYIPTLLKWAGRLTLSNFVNNKLRETTHHVITKPFWGQT